MFDLRSILYVIGLLMVPIGLSMLIPAFADALVGHPDRDVFLSSSLITLFFALVLILSNRGMTDSLHHKQAFLLTALAWIALPAVAATPIFLSELNLSFTDAYFEAMSGLTTTGSTVIEGLDTAPPGILLWRGLLQWLGGIGIIVMAVAILPMLKVGGMQLFKLEGSEASEKILPRAAELSGAITRLYIIISIACFLTLMLVGMSPFDALVHAMTTVSTGGFSTSDGSIGYFDSLWVDWVVIFFMIVGSLPFIIMLQFVRGRPAALYKDDQVRFFFGVIIMLTIAVTGWLVFFRDFSWVDSFRFGVFSIITVMTGTGFATIDYGAWGGFSMSLFFMVMFLGGCAGSTSCGVKIFRYQILLATLATEIKRLSMPHGVFITKFNGRPVNDEAVNSVMSFFFLFLVCYVTFAFLLSLTGLDFITAISGAGTALANVGPGLGEIIGPAGNFSSLPDSSKWILSMAMLTGRLELFTILVLFTPRFWQT